MNLIDRCFFGCQTSKEWIFLGVTQYFGIMSVGKVSAHSSSPPLISLTLMNGLSILFIVSTTSCESFPNLQTTKTGLSRGMFERLDTGSSTKAMKGMSKFVSRGK